MHDTPGIVCNISYNASRLSLNVWRISTVGSNSLVYALRAANCEMEAGLDVACDARLVIAFIMVLSPAAYPIRQPVIACDFETPLTMMVRCFMTSEIWAIDTWTSSV